MDDNFGAGGLPPESGGGGRGFGFWRRVKTDESFCAGEVTAAADEEERRRAAESAMGQLGP
jgi:hypothetical protein